MKWIDSILQRLSASTRSNRKSRRALAQLSLTCLEDRVTPSTVTWTGGGGNNNWSNAANWGGIAPVTGDDLVFADLGMSVTAVNDFAGGTSFSSITIQGANYTITGNAIGLTGDVSTTYSSGSSALLLDTDLGGGDAIVAPGGVLDFGGVISGLSGLTVSGGGALLLSGSGSNTYVGTTLVAEGVLVLNKAGAVAVPGNLTVGDGDGGELVQLLAADQIADGATVAVGEGAIFDLNGTSETFDDLIMQGSTVNIGAGGTLILSSSISSFDAGNNTTALIQGGTLDLNGSGSFALVANDDPSSLIDLRITSVVANGGISKSGAGVLALAGANTYAGATAVTVGAIQVEGDTALGATSGATTVSSGASVFFDGSNLSVAEGFTISGTGYGTSGALASLNGAVTISGNVNLAANSQIGAAGSATLTINGVIDDGGSTFNLTVLQGATGRTVLGGANTFDGNLVVNSGYLRATHGGALGDTATATTVTFDDTATLELSGGIALPATKSLTLTLNGANGGSASKIINVAGSNTISGTLLFAGNEQITVATGTSLTISGAISQSGGNRNLLTAGSGVLTLSGTNSYTGGTFVNGGRLVVDGSIGTSSGAFVANGATIGGSGTVPAATVNSGGTLAPGGSPGIISTGALSLNSGSIFSVELNGTTVGTQYDQANVTGAVSLGGTLSVTLGFTPALGSTFVITANDGTDAVTGTFTGLAEGATFSVSGQTFQISYVGGTGNDVTLTVLESPTATVASSVNPAVFGQPVTFSVTVAGSGATPTGNVTLVVDGVSVETVALTGGVATFTAISSLSIASHTVSVNYAGAGVYGTASGSLSGGQTVTQASTTSTVASSDPTTAPGEQVTFTATIAAMAPGSGTPTGTVTFSADGTVLATITVDVAGRASFSTPALASGTHTITASFTPASGNFLASTRTVTQTVVPPRGNDVNGDGRADIIAGTATSSSHIKVFSSADGSLIRSFLAFDGFQGGVASAGGDTNGDGFTDVIAGTATAGSHVKVFDGATGALRRSFIAFQGFQGGVVVASGDVNGDGFADVIVGTRTGGSHVKVFSGADGSEIRSLLAFSGSLSGVSVASGDIDGDGFADVIVGAAGRSSHVKVFSGRDGSLLQSFFAFPGYLGGVTVAAGDLNGDGRADVVVGAATGSSHVKVFSGRDQSELRSFLAVPGITGNLSVAVADVNGDGVLDIVASSKTGTSSITSVDGTSLNASNSFLAFGGFLGGVEVG
ncbi:Uncharacterized protein OS=Skermanella stibiiresistens SB22 GN=N825_07995 PE=4 SV=1: Autotrns_rpt: Autotrns_rpt: Autotrns_rpt: Autotrns_rpt: VCBS [Gemmata massiliana]|uniref:Bacterial Ig-like domain-containing protein n=1 Tax=Gemmata massiliana TaxID=1210884 RepID=A0A6P2CXP6_9BACT|nr:Ig-like domain repeat protein [Gemmata massiliana]VTR93771.1 Uncharacterized protein OS=Skermanella stibiiresistens SB22 GN=N825_07995 PE=4 SV=1: Autotrns_rpt: Autotrns_rpt: Autotrns_rpt: Autotrns_rpt: VCBS [Gemmata massiliana]